MSGKNFILLCGAIRTLAQLKQEGNYILCLLTPLITQWNKIISKDDEEEIVVLVDLLAYLVLTLGARVRPILANSDIMEHLYACLFVISPLVRESRIHCWAN